jgi:ketosteroid isomerase-like protein
MAGRQEADGQSVCNTVVRQCWNASVKGSALPHRASTRLRICAWPQVLGAPVDVCLCAFLPSCLSVFVRFCRRAVPLTLALLATAAIASASQTSRAQSDQDVLIALERRWNESVYSKDLAFIDSILTDDFTATYENGDTGDRAKELQLVADFNQQVESAVQDGFRVRVYRDTAVVTFTLHLVGIRQRQRAELDLRYSDVWVMSDGRWRCVSTHSTRVAEAGAARPQP